MIDLKEFLNFDELQKLQDLFSNATDLASIIIDIHGNNVTKGSNFTEYCKRYIMSTEERKEKCQQCYKECNGLKECYAGLIEFSKDITIAGEKVGTIVCGQVLKHIPDEEKYKQVASELQINQDMLINALKNVPIKSDKSVNAAVALFSEMINQFVNLKYLEIINKNKVSVFDLEKDKMSDAIQNINNELNNLNRLASMEKILSMNASIEAARSGSAGAGFAIVAKEIGDLSKSSVPAYNSIGEQSKVLKESIDKIVNVSL